MREGIPDQRHVRYITSEWFDADTVDTDINHFLSRVVPVDAAALLIKGVVLPIEWPDEREETHFPRDLVMKHLDTIEDAVRQTSELC